MRFPSPNIGDIRSQVKAWGDTAAGVAQTEEATHDKLDN
jgi:hypothetical protein